MARDGTNRGGRRVRAGTKPEPLADRLADGRTGCVLSVDGPPEPYDFTGSDIDDGALLSGVDMPEPSAYLAAQQRDGSPLGADEIYRETWEWLADKGCTQFVSKRLFEAYAQSFARFIQCEKALSDFGLLGKHPTTGAAIASPFVAMSQSFQKQANVLWYEIFDIVKANCTTDYTPLPSDPMERLLQSR
ncbi:terminase [Canibacter sp. lx-72]|uniref:P27 family phage terminase small subunit n=1 Tax=Canibacter zhuwentaonis TaxID=2837491 RepID=UPI001BDD85EE|nr:P27 family phage terminase small subunit [Canibacter zhuwentaonis]MBT1017590.1 terminase [Canibacter zhuwentaonis]